MEVMLRGTGVLLKVMKTFWNQRVMMVAQRYEYA